MAFRLTGAANEANLPQMTSSVHSHSLYSGTGQAMGYVEPTTPFQGFQGLGPPRAFNLGNQQDDLMVQAMREHNQHKMEQKKMATPARRLIKVIIVDPDEKVPLEKCLLYSGEEKLTDLTDQELFYEIEIKDMLDDHNEVRAKIVDKTVKERTEYLEPIKVRDLRMVVVTVAQF